MRYVSVGGVVARSRMADRSIARGCRRARVTSSVSCRMQAWRFVARGRCIRSTLRWEQFASYRRTYCELLIFETSTNPTVASSPLELIFLPRSRRGLQIVAR